MGFNPCCCWNLKDGCVTVGIWSLVYAFASLGLFGWQFVVLNECRAVTMSQANLQCQIFCIAQMGIFGWQTAAIKYEKDRAANTLLPNYNTYGRFDVPSYYETYWQSPEEKFYTGLFIIQILCLIAAFFLLFASVSLIYGIHTNSRYLVWPWFPCIVTSILCSIAYCVMWWSGDVRGYWLVLTILEILSVLINVYCLIAVIAQYKNIVAGRGEPEWYKQCDQTKDTVVYYDPRHQNGYIEPIKNNQYHGAIHHNTDGQYNIGYTNYDNSYEHEKVNVPFSQQPPYGGYGYDYNAQMADELPPKTAPQDPETSGGEDYTSQWVKQSVHQPPAPFPQPLTEPPSPVKEDAPILHHAQSVPSIQVDKHHRHSKRHSRHHHRAHSVGSRSRRSSKTFSSDSEDSDDDRRRRCRHCHKRRHQSRSRSRDKYSDTDTGYSERSYKHTDKHRRHRHRDDDECDCESKRRHRRPRDVKRDNREKNTAPLVTKAETSIADNSTWPPKYPPTSAQGGISIPQHIVIPPSSGVSDKPQRYQINSEITISYNKADKAMPQGEAADVRGRLSGGQKRLPASIAGNSRGQQMITQGRSGGKRDSSDSMGAGSLDSRGQGSTAV